MTMRDDMKLCLALRHVAFEDLGTWGPILERRGFAIDCIDVGVDDLETARILEADLAIVLGGPIGVYEADSYPFLVGEIEMIGRRLGLQRPTLGICLGAQLMAKSLGADVAPGPAKEIGWAPIELTDAGRTSPLRHLENVDVLHWHGDNFDLPPACQGLAFTAHCPFQAFSRGQNVLGLQFHIEADPRRIEAWLIGHTIELGRAAIDPRAIRRDTARYGRALPETGGRIFNEWLDAAGF
jgi:GMP synthase (glutamine-hydrolysing)